MTLAYIQKKLGIIAVEHGYHVPGGEYTDDDFELLLEWAKRQEIRQQNKLRYETRFERGKNVNPTN